MVFITHSNLELLAVVKQNTLHASYRGILRLRKVLRWGPDADDGDDSTETDDRTLVNVQRRRGWDENGVLHQHINAKVESFF